MPEDQPQDASQSQTTPPPVAPPPVRPAPMQPSPQPVSDPLIGLVPYKNKNALIAYYLGLFSIFPVLGLVMGAIAVWLGVQGSRFANENPDAKGKTHAGIGIGCGAIGLLFNLALAGLIIAALVGSRH